MEEGRLTSRDLVQQYLTRIAVYENRLNATITVNPNALAEAGTSRSGEGGVRSSWAAARNPDRTEGQHTHHGHAHDGWCAGV